MRKISVKFVKFFKNVNKYKNQKNISNINARTQKNTYVTSTRIHKKGRKIRKQFKHHSFLKIVEFVTRLQLFRRFPTFQEFFPRKQHSQKMSGKNPVSPIKPPPLPERGGSAKGQLISE